MIFDYETLRVIWWVLIGALFVGFALTDGFDMGVGTLLPFLGRNNDERRVMINTVGPHWDGNQVWFILAGGAIFAAWPLVYAAAFSGFYVALLLVLFALFFRPVGFDYRSKVDDPRWRSAWDWGLFAGSAVPALVFGVAFGNLLQGVPFYLDGNLRAHYDGSFFGLLNPFALLTGIVSLSMLVMHGATYLQMRTDGVLLERARGAARLAAIALIVTFALAGIWLGFGIDGYRITTIPALDAPSNPLAKTVAHVAGAWLANYKTYPWAVIAPVLGFAGALGVLVFSAARRGALAFVSSALSVMGVIVTAGVSMFPFIMPSSLEPNSSLTVWDATSSPYTLTLMFWATLVFLPIVLGYTIWVYKVMGGKVTVQQMREQTHTVY
ncbi:MAG: cytochrome d ubiquinol oxidase subunit II [Sulfuricaulis sp.]|uniref:cytochrome d ubiquinol oxidase subunit II n=1 Tax=Sulfuricaulis sp. TaxID=2003553 RepID=UPI003C57CBB5